MSEKEGTIIFYGVEVGIGVWDTNRRFYFSHLLMIKKESIFALREEMVVWETV